MSSGGGLRRKWGVATFGVLIAIVGGVSLIPALGQPKNCITDAELDAVVGDQIRAGAFSINTSKLREAPMCSGLTVAQAIQKLSDNVSSRGAASASSQQASLSNSEAGRSLGAGVMGEPNSYAELATFAGNGPETIVGGYTFWRHPLVLKAVEDIGANGPYYLPIHEKSYFNRMEGHVLVNGGCFPESCKTEYHRLFMNLETGATAVCFVGGQWSEKLWFSSIAPNGPVEFAGFCPESYRSAPANIRNALATRSSQAGQSTSLQQVSDPKEPSLARLLEGNWEITDPDYDPGRCTSRKGEVEFEMAKFKPGGKFEYIGQDAGGSGTWSASGQAFKTTLDGETYTYSVKKMSNDHLLVTVNVPNGGTQRYRRCPWSG